MSQFGYQQNYQTKTQGTPQYGPPSGQPDPNQYQPAKQGIYGLPTPPPPMAAPNPYGPINFNPEVTEAWSNPNRYVSGWTESSKNPGFGDITKTQGTSRTNVYSYEPWRNPVKDYFGNIQGNQEGKSAPSAFGYVGYNTPQTTKDLYGVIQGLNANQLQQLSGRYQGVIGNFRLAAQDYANAYANPIYSRGAGVNYSQSSSGGVPHEQYNTLGPGTTMKQQQNADWLQASENLLTSRMNNAYLL